MSSKNNNLSVVICTKDRPILLDRCIKSLHKQLQQGDEILVIDNSLLHSSRSIAEHYNARWIPEQRPGAGWARNRGYREAKHDIIAYIDDDCIADIVWAEELRNPFHNSKIGVVTGAVLGERTDLLISNLVDSEYSFHRGWKAISYHGSTGTRWSPLDIWRVGVGGTMAWRRAVLDQIKGFDPALGAGTPPGSCEDIDALRRALVQGATIHYQPTALVWHKHPEYMTDLELMFQRYSITLGAHAMKMVIEEKRWLAIVYILIDWWEQISLALSLLRPSTSKNQLHLSAKTLLLQPPLSFLGMLRFVQYKNMLRKGLSPKIKQSNRKVLHQGAPLKSEVMSSEIELTESLTNHLVTSPTWLLVRLHKRPIARVFVPAGKSYEEILYAQLEDEFRSFLNFAKYHSTNTPTY